jgi:hypothetical protein
MTAPVACVIAQQYSSAIFASLRLHSSRGKIGARFKNVILIFLLFFKFRESKTAYHETTNVGECLYIHNP